MTGFGDKQYIHLPTSWTKDFSKETMIKPLMSYGQEDNPMSNTLECLEVDT